MDYFLNVFLTIAEVGFIGIQSIANVRFTIFCILRLLIHNHTVFILFHHLVSLFLNVRLMRQSLMNCNKCMCLVLTFTGCSFMQGVV